VQEVLSNQERTFQSLLRKFQKRTRSWDGKEVVVGYLISDEVNNSELLNNYLVANPDVSVACQISFGLQKVSYRSRGDFDVARLAKAHGGGGHTAAAGNPLPTGLIERVISESWELPS
jgi:nanoRNase/pAp phosphatase (c-di-AMP/oligoRNAs hydrolase)